MGTGRTSGGAAPPKTNMVSVRTTLTGQESAFQKVNASCPRSDRLHALLKKGDSDVHAMREGNGKAFDSVSEKDSKRLRN